MSLNLYHMKAPRIVKLNEHLQVQEPQTPQTKDTQILTKIQEARIGGREMCMRNGLFCR